MKIDVTATELDEAGCGVGAAGGRNIHVADLLPGEWAEVAVDHASPHKAEAWAHIVKRIGPESPERVPPACPAFGRCGGCVWQHVSYGAQLQAKRDRVVAALGAQPCPIADVRPSPAELGYRNKGKYVVGAAANGDLILGAYAPRSHHVVDTLGCRVVAPVIDEVATWLRGAATRAGFIAYDEQTRTGELRYAIIREAEGDVMIVLVVSSAAPRSKLEAVANGMAKHAAVRGIVAITNDRRDGAIVPSGSTARVLLGHGYLVEKLAGVPIEVGASEFMQVNRAQAAAMYTRVAELAAGGTRALDLFAGLGGIGLHLAKAGMTVTSVEIDADAVSQLRRAAEHAKLPLTAIAGDAAELALGGFDVVVVNPPRKGLAGALPLVASIQAQTIIYVSCGPDSLGRDLAALAEHGYQPDVIEPFDLMPGTAQVETVVRLKIACPALPG
ncbi:MAG: 23S rRNA (uracil(1939)-C(5))-methyltransferase RlmD [Kofleriaceae bacterium]